MASNQSRLIHKRGIRTKEIGLFLTMCAILALLLFLAPGNQDSVRLTLEVRQFPLNPLFDTQHDLSSVPVFEISVQQEFIDALNAAIPKNFDGQKVRFKKVPIDRLIINGKEITGHHTIRYRGWFFHHWREKEKSIKLELGNNKFRGYRTFNLNAQYVDPYLFEHWAGELATASGVLASRIGIAKLIINGKFAGLRAITENLDSDLIRVRNLSKGHIYRERTKADLGGAASNLKDLWKKNSMKSSNWYDLEALNRAIQSSTDRNTEEYLEFIDLEKYINYQAIVALTGSVHLSDHNIPMYRPKFMQKFEWIGYDFEQDELSRYGHLFLKLQIPYLVQNRHNYLYWKDSDFRIRTHQRILEILLTSGKVAFKKHKQFVNLVRSLAYQNKKEKLWFTDLSSTRNMKEGRKKEKYLTETRIEDRMDFFKKGYLQPSLLIQDQWKTKRQFQFVINGLSSYQILIKTSLPCAAWNSTAEIRIHDSAIEKHKCQEGTIQFTAERNDVPFPIKKKFQYHYKNSIGAILVEVSLPRNIFAHEIKVTSLITNNSVPYKGNWPFDLKTISPGMVHLGEKIPQQHKRLSPHTLGFAPYNLMPEFLKFDVKGTHVHTLKLPDLDRYGMFYGPIICWNLDYDKGCFEFTRRFLGLLDEKKKVLEPELNLADIRQNRFLGCKTFTFSRGDWNIKEPISIPVGCKIVFQSGANLKFAPGSYLVVSGEFIFPKKIPAVKFGAANKDWGGVIFQNPERGAIVEHAIFSNANEFYFKGKRYTGALNIINPFQIVIKNNAFINNYGDDGLNLMGGSGKVLSNYFKGNRDAVDFDESEGLIQYNYFIDSLDDGVDSGNCKNLVVDSNYFIGSGDKAISIGEKSSVRIENNIITSGTVGVAVKDSSSAILRKNIISGNSVGLSEYSKISTLSQTGIGASAGDSWFVGNKVSYKLNLNPSKIELSNVLKLEIPKLRLQTMLKEIGDHCHICLTYVKK